MPKLKNRVPSYRLHKASGRAVVTIGGRDHYLGPYGGEASRAEYKRLIAEWLSATKTTAGVQPDSVAVSADTRIDELLLAYLQFAETYYVKNGRPTGETTNIKHAVQPLTDLYGQVPIRRFGPKQLKTVRQRMVDAGLSRRVINSRVNRLRRVFRWGVENEMVESGVLQALKAVAPLKYGRTEAPENPPVTPVPEVYIQAVLPLVTRPVKAMIEAQMLTGMRPGEVVQLRASDMDMSGSTWTYRPASHKTEHHGIERVIFIGPRCQEILRPFLTRSVMSYLFSPKDALQDARCRQQQRANRAWGKYRRKLSPRKVAGDRYTNKSYCFAIHKACKKAGIPCWGPNRLRHNAATALRKQYGIEAARVILGHQSAGITEIYAECDRGKAAEIMSHVG